MKINILGDSITEGACASCIEKSFVYLVGQMLNAETRNYGIGGTRIARQLKPSTERGYDYDYCQRVEKMNNDADYVIVFGGTNDYGHGDAPMGKMGDNTPYTFYGAMDYLVNELFKYYKKEQIVFILPTYRFYEDDPEQNGCSNKEECGWHPLSEYRRVMVEVLNKYNIDIFDIKDELGRPENNDMYFDGLHPTDKGHYKIAELIANYFKNK